MPLLSKSYYYPNEPESKRRSSGDDVVPDVKSKVSDGIADGSKVPLSPSEQNYKSVRRILRNTFRDYNEGDIEYKRILYKCTCVWLELYYLFDFDYSLYTVAQYTRCFNKFIGSVFSDLKGRCQTWMKYFKYRNASFFSYHNKQEMPPNGQNYKSKVRSLLGGMFFRFEKVLIRDGRMLQFSANILQSKKGFPRPDIKAVEEAVIKHVETMTTEKPSEESIRLYEFIRAPLKNSEPYSWFWQQYPLDNLDDIEYTKRDFIDSLQEVMEEIFGESDFSLDTLTQPVLPSVNANNQWSIRKLGTMRNLYETCKENLDENFDLPCYYDNVTLSEYIPESYGIDHQLNSAFPSDEEKIEGVVDLEYFDVWYKKLYWKMYSKAMSEAPMVKPVGLAEALKVRVISKGPPHTYFVLKPMQKFLWGQLQRFWNFELTGQPISVELLNKRFKGVYGDNYLSGDYESATDELHSWTSEAACNILIDILERKVGFCLDSLRHLMLNALTRHLYDVDGELKPQLRGQLMGSIISFPFLCIINMTLIKVAYEKTHHLSFRSIRDIPAWFNGDDCLIEYGNYRFPAVWEQIGSFIGLSKSIGKSYDMKKFLTVNSTYFTRDGHMKWNLIPIVNLGVLYGLKRSSQGAENSKYWEEELLDLSSRFRDLMKDLDHSPLKKKTKERFLYINGELLNKSGLNWVLPQYLGGLGLPVRDFDRGDKVIAHAILKEYSENRPPPLIKKETGFLLHKKVMRMIRDYLPLVTEYECKYDCAQEYGKIYTAFCYKVMCQTTLDDYMNAAQYGTGQLRKLQKWYKQFQVKFESGQYKELCPARSEYLRDFSLKTTLILRSL